VITGKGEDWILVINFYSVDETLVRVGWPEGGWVSTYLRRVETFYIADDEQLIGC
jgi:hypothetical protein